MRNALKQLPEDFKSNNRVSVLLLALGVIFQIGRMAVAAAWGHPLMTLGFLLGLVSASIVAYAAWVAVRDYSATRPALRGAIGLAVAVAGYLGSGWVLTQIQEDRASQRAATAEQLQLARENARLTTERGDLQQELNLLRLENGSLRDANGQMMGAMDDRASRRVKRDRLTRYVNGATALLYRCEYPHADRPEAVQKDYETWQEAVEKYLGEHLEQADVSTFRAPPAGLSYDWNNVPPELQQTYSGINKRMDVLRAIVARLQ